VLTVKLLIAPACLPAGQFLTQTLQLFNQVALSSCNSCQSDPAWHQALPYRATVAVALIGALVALKPTSRLSSSANELKNWRFSIHPGAGLLRCHHGKASGIFFGRKKYHPHREILTHRTITPFNHSMSRNRLICLGGVLSPCGKRLKHNAVTGF